MILACWPKRTPRCLGLITHNIAQSWYRFVEIRPCDKRYITHQMYRHLKKAQFSGHSGSFGLSWKMLYEILIVSDCIAAPYVKHIQYVTCRRGFDQWRSLLSPVLLQSVRDRGPCPSALTSCSAPNARKITGPTTWSSGVNPEKASQFHAIRISSWKNYFHASQTCQTRTGSRWGTRGPIWWVEITNDDLIAYPATENAPYCTLLAG